MRAIEIIEENNKFIDDLTQLYNEAGNIGLDKILREDFTDDDFSDDFFQEYTGETLKPKIGDYILMAIFMRVPKKEILILRVEEIKTKYNISQVNKDVRFVSSKYFKTYNNLQAFLIILKMKYSHKYDIQVDHESI